MPRPFLLNLSELTFTLQDLELNSTMPAKVGGLVFEDFEKPSPAAVDLKMVEQGAQPEEEDDSWRHRWVGEVDLPES